MGNSRYHSYMYPVLLRHPGLMVLHDFCLAGFHLHYGHARGEGMGFINEKLRHWYPEQQPDLDDRIASWPTNWEEISRECSTRGWYLNREVLAASMMTVFHSPWCRATIGKNSPEYLDSITIIPHGIHPRRTTTEERAEVRDRTFNLPQDGADRGELRVRPPRQDESAGARRLRGDRPRKPRRALRLRGRGGRRRRGPQGTPRRLGLNDRVVFLGRQSYDDFTTLMTVTDVGVNLRMPPTNGETSGALLNLLAAGVPTVVTDVATFSDYPATVVRKVKWETFGPPGLLQAMRGLANNPAARQALGRAAWDYVDEYHEWSRVARLYVDAIEQCHELRAKPRGRVAPRPSAPATF